jgi:hypothetical protein
MPEPLTQPTPLVCSNCIKVDRDGLGLGWRADWAHDREEEPELVIVCPRWWSVEFSDDPFFR